VVWGLGIVTSLGITQFAIQIDPREIAAARVPAAPPLMGRA
jgi:hypothetical protein